MLHLVEDNTMRQTVQPMDRKMMRELNQNMLLNLIRLHAPISRTQLKKMSGLSLGTIVGITSALIEQELVIETGVAESTGGRKPGLLEVYPEGGYVVGIDLREHEVLGAILNLHGNVIYCDSWPAQLRNNGAHAVDILARGTEDFIARSQIPRSKILGLGCGISGPVNAQTGVNVDSWILNWHNVELALPLSERLHIPVFTDNAVNCLACYKKLYGNGQKYRNFLLVTLGRGLGLATVVRDDLFRGAQGIGAEFGHIPFYFEDGRLCECGNYGCLEAYVSHHGILATYRSLAPDARTLLTIYDLVSLAQQGDQLALQAFERTGTYLGAGLATLVNLFNPECLIIEGSGDWADLFLKTMHAALHEHIFSQIGHDLELIVESDADMFNWARGAGCLVLRDFFSSPIRLDSVEQPEAIRAHSS
jgi:N-acetylglucosamine repressor